MIEWLMGKLGVKLGHWHEEGPIGTIVGKVAGESMLTKKLIPLLSNSNPTVRDNAYCAIRTAEDRLGKRLLRE
jgi:hypothetical protein